MSDHGPLFIAIDAGTTGARATAVDSTGRVVRESRRSYPTRIPHPGWAEQDPADWRKMAVRAAFDLIEALGGAAHYPAIGLTGQCPTIAPLNAAGDAVGPGLLYRDNRATAEAAEMRERVGIQRMHAVTGHVAEAFHVGPKVLWLRRHRPEVFAEAEVFMQPRDVVLHELTGEKITDETHANSTVLFDLARRAWADDLLDSFAIDASRFPKVEPPWSRGGVVAQRSARQAGLPAGCSVIVGAADSQCAAFGSGVNEPGAISEMAGASSCINSIVYRPLNDVRITHYSHVLPERYCTELGANTTGAAVQWAVDRLAFGGFEPFEMGAGRVYDMLARGSTEDPLALAPLFLPYLGDGERDDVALRAGFVGLADRHGREELAYAVLEGVAFSVAEIIEILVAAGAPCEELRVAGGGTRLSTLGQIKADALDVPVLHLEADTAPVGAAMLAAHAAGYADEAQRAIMAGVHRARRFEPSGTASELVCERREWFRRVRSSEAIRLGARSSDGARR